MKSVFPLAIVAQLLLAPTLHSTEIHTPKIEGTLQDCLYVPSVIEVNYLQLRELCFKDPISKVEWTDSSEYYFNYRVEKEIPKNYAVKGVKGILRIQVNNAMRGQGVNIFITFADGNRIEKTIKIPEPIGDLKSSSTPKRLK